MIIYAERSSTLVFCGGEDIVGTGSSLQRLATLSAEAA